MIGQGDTASAQVTWAKGAMAYVGSGLGTGFAISNGSPAQPQPRSAPWPMGSCSTRLSGVSSLDLTEGWSVVGGFEHHWSPQWKTSLYGTYGAISYSAAAKAAFPALVDDWSMYQVGSRTVWTPVANLDLSVDVMYNHINTAFDPIAGFEDKGWWQGMFRVQRNFYP